LNIWNPEPTLSPSFTNKNWPGANTYFVAVTKREKSFIL
jgi:hypothetical protein